LRAAQREPPDGCPAFTPGVDLRATLRAPPRHGGCSTYGVLPGGNAQRRVVDCPWVDDDDHSRRRLTTELTKRERPSPVAPTVPAETNDGRLVRGTPVDRYIVLDVLGAGGMGVVYSAFDPELDRKVAIKLLQAAGADTRDTEPLPAVSETRLVREAQALARLSHPNVIAVHDVGVLPGHRVFVAMELVEGKTLRGWLRAVPRTWRDVLPVMRAAGAGLAAAHAAGLVHRDFKPDNVMVGNDGRVRVMDFGLARMHRDPRPEPELHIATPRPLAAALTREGTVMGTPAYMAPEIYAGAEIDARADQFAFGVALYEAMFGTRPFGDDELAQPTVAPPTPPADAKVPAWLARVALRAIAIDPAARYGSMDELLGELVEPPRRRRGLIAGAIVVVAGGGIAAAFALRSPPPAQELCTGAERRLAGVWDPAVAATAKAAFLATNKPAAATSFAGISHALDAYAAEWTAASTDACRATRILGEQTEDVMTLREECLGQRLEEMRAFTHLVAGAEGNLVDLGDKAVFGLDPIASCANVAALRAPGLPPPERHAAIAEVEKEVAAAKAELIAGRFLPALTASAKAQRDAEAVGWAPLAAEAQMARGGALLATGSFDDGARAFSDATWSALRGRRDDLAATAALSTALVTADPLGNPDKGKVWLELGITSASRAGVDRVVELRRYETEGVVLAEAGDVLAGIAAHAKALQLAELAFGKDSPALFNDEQLLAASYGKAGAYAKAIPHFERSLQLRVASVGREQLEIAILESNLGLAYRHVRDFARARAVLEHSIAVREKLFGQGNLLLVAPFDNLADVERAQGNYAAALALYDRGIKLAAFVPGKTHVNYHQIATDRAEVLGVAGHFKEAHAAYDGVLALEETNHSPLLAHTKSSRAQLALEEHAWADAETWAERAIHDFEARGGTDNPHLWLPLTRLGEARIGRGDLAGARQALERALAIGTRAEVTPQDLDRTREAFVKASR
jgi:eukaryotic-like serine/threonine-protein kinase